MTHSRIDRRAARLSIALAAAAWLLAPPATRAAEPVKHVGIYVEPFYRSARNPADAPTVGTGKPYADLLASTKAADIAAARDMILAKPQLVTPMTMMVLAIRFYDVGMRDDAVFWFYAAKDRFIALVEVAEPNTPVLAQSNEAMHAFATLAGPIINGYAFCSIEKQKDIRAKALAWVESNPYEMVFNAQIPARAADRRAALERAIAHAKENAAKERAYLEDPKNVETFKVARARNDADAKFCWN